MVHKRKEKIYEPVMENAMWGIKRNNELQGTLGEIKMARIRWAGYL